MNQITNNLWISDIDSVLSEDTSKFERVVSVCQDTAEDNVGCEYDHFKLADGEPVGLNPGECTYSLFKEAARTVLNALRNQETVLVHCHAGQSRSVAVSTAALAVYNDDWYDNSFLLVKKKRPQAGPNHILIGFAKQFIEECEQGYVYTPSKDY